jgi:cysteinyl-tRNA synthetase
MSRGLVATTFRLYNTLSRSVEPLSLRNSGHLRFYSCGPTVYSYAHIGNFRSFLTADLIYRTARSIGWDVTYATNITDVGHLSDDDLMDPEGEDRMVRALKSREGDAFANIWDLARFYTNVLLDDWRHLNLLEPTVRPRATDHMREQIVAVEKLLESGHAYETDQGVYFSVNSFPDYGKLSGNTLADDLEQHVRDVVVDADKKDPRDFALWKKDENHLMQWYSPWGWGFPGWHIECSVMAQTYLGQQIDLHAGGEDLIFPHHECEIAQSESLSGQTFARHWVHTRFLQVEGEKMSKSEGNFFTVRDLIAPEKDGGRAIDPLAVRMTLLAGYYRKPFNFTFDTLKASIRHRERFQEALERIDRAIEMNAQGKDVFENILSAQYERCREAMLDDLNTPAAVAATLEGLKAVLAEGELLSASSASTARQWLNDTNDLLGIVFHDEPIAEANADETEFESEIDHLLSERTRAREEKNFARADEIRKQLTALNIEIMDTPDGPRWKRITSLD